LALVLRPGARAGDEAKEKLPAPSKEEQEKAAKTVKELFEKDLDKAKGNSTALKELAAVILKEGRATNAEGDAPLRFAAFVLARDVASEAGDHTLALEAIAELAQGFKVDTSAMKAEALAAAAKTAEGKEANTSLAEAALQMVEEALENDNYKAALGLLATAQTAAINAKSLALASRVKKINDEVKATQKEFDRVKPFLEKLQSSPDNKEANLEAGKYYALLKGNFEKGLPLLIKGGDEALKSLAEKDLAKPKLTKKRIELADAWNTLGDKDKGPFRKNLLRRALYWYTEALTDPDVTGLSRVRMERRVEEIAKEYPIGPASISFGGSTNITAEIRQMVGQQANANGVAVSRDGKIALTGGGNDNFVRVWDVKNGKLIRSMAGHNSPIEGVAISPDGKTGASGGRDNSIRIWDLNNGQLIRTIQQHFDYVRVVHFSPDGKKLYSASDDRTVRIWDVNNGTQLKSMTGHTAYINAFSISKDAKRGLTCSDDNKAVIWDLENGKEITRFNGHTSKVWGGALSPDGKTAITSSYDGTVRVWDATSAKELRRLDAKGMVWCIVFAPDGKRALTGNGGIANFGQVNPGGDNNIRLWDVASGKEIRSLGGHTNYVRGLAITPDGRTVVSVSFDGTVRVWGTK
jgi:WD40 repeat protein